MSIGKIDLSGSDLDRVLAARATRHLAARRLQRELSREKAVRKEIWKSKLQSVQHTQTNALLDKNVFNQPVNSSQQPSPLTSRESTISDSMKRNDANEVNYSTDSMDDLNSGFSVSVSSLDSSGWRSRYKNALKSPSSSFLGMDMAEYQSLSPARPANLYDQQNFRTPFRTLSKSSSFHDSIPLTPTEQYGVEFLCALKTAQEDDSSSSHSSSSQSTTKSTISCTDVELLTKFVKEPFSLPNSSSDSNFLLADSRLSIINSVQSDFMKDSLYEESRINSRTPEQSMSIVTLSPTTACFGGDADNSQGWRSRLQRLTSGSILNQPSVKL